MLIGNRLRLFRETKGLSPRDIENIVGVRCSHLSRIENNHHLPTIDTLDKLATALDIPVYAILHEDKPRNSPIPEPLAPGESRKDQKFIERLRPYLGHMKPEDRELLFRFALILCKRKYSRSRRRSVAKSIVLEDRRREVTIVPERIRK